LLVSFTDSHVQKREETHIHVKSSVVFSGSEEEDWSNEKGKEKRDDG